VLYSRDLTQANWTLTNATTALDQTGIDGSANTASSITATAGSATVCQAITLASAQMITTVYLKRITGTGAITISQDNNSTTTTTTLTSNWQRFNKTWQTLANPTVCINLATNGDKIAVDVVQLEKSSGYVAYTSPIPTTSATVTRATDVLSVTVPTPNLNSGSFTTQFINHDLGPSGGRFFGQSTMNIAYNNTNMQINEQGTNIGTTGNNVISIAGGSYTTAVYAGFWNGSLISLSSKPTKPSASTTATFLGTPHWLQNYFYYNNVQPATIMQRLTLYQYPLDQINVTPTSAYSLRKLRAAYLGNAINVTRSSDSTSSDIGFVNGNLDVATLLTFCATTTCTVGTWYDQYGSNNMVQATGSKQPIIVSSGVLQTNNGLPALYYNSSNTASTSATIGALPIYTINGVVQWLGGGSVMTSYNDQTTSIIEQIKKTQFSLNGNTTGSYDLSVGAQIFTGLRQTAYNSTIYINGTQSGSPAYTTLATPAYSILYIGNNYAGTAATSENVSELIIFPSLLTAANRQVLEHNQEQYYGIGGA
jgi:hypothetical protein